MHSLRNSLVQEAMVRRADALRSEARPAVLRELMEEKFGRLSRIDRSTISRASDLELMTWIECVPGAQSADEVLNTTPAQLQSAKAEGKARGEFRGRVEAIEHLLCCKFAGQWPSIRHALFSASVGQLETWTGRILTAATLDEVFGTAATEEEHPQYPSAGTAALYDAARRADHRGNVRGHVDVLVQLLTLRFGPLPWAALDTIEKGSIDDIERWSENALGRATLDSVFQDTIIEAFFAYGYAEAVVKRLTAKFGTLPETTIDTIKGASIIALKTWSARVATASTLDEALSRDDHHGQGQVSPPDRGQ